MRKHLLMVGGGHAHLFVLEALRKQRAQWQSHLDVTLVSRDIATPYSGMLPGLIAGHYRTMQAHIDLRPLADAAGVRLVQGAIDRFDPDGGLASGEGQEWRFDLASLDIGSTLPMAAVPGAVDHALGVRPVGNFLTRWRQMLDQINDLARPVHIVVVGGGAGGVEVVLAMAHRLAAYRERIKWSLVTRGELLPDYPRAAAQRMTERLAQAGIALLTDIGVTQVDDGIVHFADGSTAAFDALVWATGAGAQSWPAASGLASVDGDFIHVNRYLQSVSHPHVFAAGDIATDPHQRRPKAGVFAVRQGPVLAANLLRYAAGGSLNRYRPQRDYLSLLSIGGQHAIGCWYGLVWEGDWVWRWKDRIDRRFMRRFSAPFDSSA